MRKLLFYRYLVDSLELKVHGFLEFCEAKYHLHELKTIKANHYIFTKGFV